MENYSKEVFITKKIPAICRDFYFYKQALLSENYFTTIWLIQEAPEAVSVILI